MNDFVNKGWGKKSSFPFPKKTSNSDLVKSMEVFKLVRSSLYSVQIVFQFHLCKFFFFLSNPYFDFLSFLIWALWNSIQDYIFWYKDHFHSFYLFKHWKFILRFGGFGDLFHQLVFSRFVLVRFVMIFWWVSFHFYFLNYVDFYVLCIYCYLLLLREKNEFIENLMAICNFITPWI